MLRLHRLTALLIGLALLTSCASSRDKKKQRVSQQADLFIGTVALVNRDAGFVLIDQGQQAGPESGVVLKTHRGAVETGEVVASAVRKRPFIIADIKTGLPQKGDRVYFPMQLRAAPAPVALPAPPVQPTTSEPSPDVPDLFPQPSSEGVVDQ